MADFVRLIESDDCISVTFYIEDEQVTALGERLAEICEDAYMNGYNWDALLSPRTGTCGSDRRAGHRRRGAVRICCAVRR